MKIKINNIFKNLNKDINHGENVNKEFNIKRRNNTSQVSDSIVKEEIYREEYGNYRRRGAAKNKNIFYLLKKIKYSFSIKKSYYILFALMSLLAITSVYTNFLTYKENNNESYEVFNSNDGEKEIQKVESSVSEELQDTSSNNIDTRVAGQIQNVTSNTNVKKNTTAKETVVPLSFVKPINGEIIKIYSVNELLFSKTLESWKTHDGVDIKANVGESVKSIEKGIIEKIYEDSFYGMTIIIDHGQGYKSIYSNLESKVNVSEKQVVKKSFAIGKLGKTSIGEIKDDPHVHFMLMFNNKVIDPTSKIKF